MAATPRSSAPFPVGASRALGGVAPRDAVGSSEVASLGWSPPGLPDSPRLAARRRCRLEALHPHGSAWRCGAPGPTVCTCVQGCWQPMAHGGFCAIRFLLGLRFGTKGLWQEPQRSPASTCTSGAQSSERPHPFPYSGTSPRRSLGLCRLASVGRCSVTPAAPSGCPLLREPVGFMGASFTHSLAGLLRAVHRLLPVHGCWWSSGRRGAEIKSLTSSGHVCSLPGPDSRRGSTAVRQLIVLRVMASCPSCVSHICPARGSAREDGTRLLPLRGPWQVLAGAGRVEAVGQAS